MKMRQFLVLSMRQFEILSNKLWFLAIICANMRRMETKSRWSGKQKEVGSDLYYSVSLYFRFWRICAISCFLDENAPVFLFLDDVNMVFRDYMSEYASDADEK